jgi:hypothetical protein
MRSISRQSHSRWCSNVFSRLGGALLIALALAPEARTDEVSQDAVEAQPLAANIRRVLQSLDYLGAPLPAESVDNIETALKRLDAGELQRAVDPHVLFVVTIDHDAQVSTTQGNAKPQLQQAGFVPVLVKIINRAESQQRLIIESPQAGPVYGGVAELSMRRQQQEHLRAEGNNARAKDPFLSVEMFQSPPMKDQISGLAIEYAIALLYSSEASRREASIGFSLGGKIDENATAKSPNEVAIGFDVRPAVPVRLSVTDYDGKPTMARLLFQDALGHVYPPQAKRLAPDLFFQPHIYRGDGETVLLPPGEFRLQSNRGPEYRVVEREVTVNAGDTAVLAIPLERWIDPAAFGFYCGDHHIHAAGCAHYNVPTQGVAPTDMFRQVKGEGLNVGCVLTWGPCFEYQRQFFTPRAHELSDESTVLKYDLEISGFGSQALGHVCLLGLKDQLYPGTEGTTQGWPTWTTPVMRWAKKQGGYTGYAHSASGLQIDPEAAAKRLLSANEADKSGELNAAEAAEALLPEPFEAIDADGNRLLSLRELRQSHDRVADRLPNLAIPEMNGVGAMEIAVSAAEGVCDFISAMDTPRIQEWNCWYHLLNCGFPIKVSGETDFPCMSSRSVGQGRVYVQLGKTGRVDLAAWCAGLAAGKSYVSDGYAHALKFSVDNQTPGGVDVLLDEPGKVVVRASVAFAAETPLAVAYGSIVPKEGRRLVGDTVLLHGPRNEETVKGGRRLVEIVVNGEPVTSREVPADGKIHELEFSVPINRSSWVALREFPQLHTNPVNVLVANRPIRASKDSAQWCIETIELLWKNRRNSIAASERDEAKRTFDRAIERYRQIAREADAE